MKAKINVGDSVDTERVRRLTAEIIEILKPVPVEPLIERWEAMKRKKAIISQRGLLSRNDSLELMSLNEVLSHQGHPSDDTSKSVPR